MPFFPLWRSCDNTLENCFFKNFGAYLRITYNKTKVQIPAWYLHWENKTYKLKRPVLNVWYRNSKWFFLCGEGMFLTCKEVTDMSEHMSWFSTLDGIQWELCQHYYKPGGSGIMPRNVSCLSKPLKRLQDKIPTGIRLAKISHSSFTTNNWVSPNLFFFSLRIPNVMVLRTPCVFIYYNATTTIPVISCWNTSGKHNINLFVSWLQALIPSPSIPSMLVSRVCLGINVF